MAHGWLPRHVYGGLLVFLGPGSMFFHGGLTHFGGWLDNLSMILYVTFILCYDAAALAVGRSDRRLLRDLRRDQRRPRHLHVVRRWSARSSSRILAGVAVVLRASSSSPRPRGITRQFIPWLLLGLISFGIATFIWPMWSTGAPLCDPNSLFQGHAVWHLLAMAVTPFCIFRYLRGETRS